MIRPLTAAETVRTTGIATIPAKVHSSLLRERERRPRDFGLNPHIVISLRRLQSDTRSVAQKVSAGEVQNIRLRYTTWYLMQKRLIAMQIARSL